MSYHSELMADLEQADASGDMQLAKVIAGKIKEHEGQSFLGNVGRGTVAAAADVGRTLTKPIGWVSPDFKAYMDRSGDIARDLHKTSGVGGSIGAAGVDIAATAGMPIARAFKPPAVSSRAPLLRCPSL